MRTRRWQSRKGWLFISVGGEDDCFKWLLELGPLHIGWENSD